MKNSQLLFLLITLSFTSIAEAKEKKVNPSFLLANVQYASRYKGVNIQYHYSVYKNYTLGISYTAGQKNISIPDYVSSKLDEHYDAPYDKIKNVDLLFGKKMDVVNNELILQINTGLSYLYFQEHVHYFPFNCKLASDVKLTQALGVTANALVHINTKHRTGLDFYLNSNLNPEKIVFGAGVGFRFGKMKL